ncbi:uncharacterized protein MONBRDRAFT_34276 [Monosiga brevicollis MX1]|uniref:phenylalanine--tRNA ligase n=2 Tax=Monosiga brevicollis TaxID=81824 RepID=A9VAM7_MONBE|nr:uncharacterized protein MONBRDRAFT_34276 [Monosiga brevicollis MX1]EDQ85350.1 predicted protein [Monosiga brevicollis MX1]|eukprot:XP_001749761.1 hypothetical protein [Monosiga brevicollis MX1]
MHGRLVWWILAFGSCWPIALMPGFGVCRQLLEYIEAKGAADAQALAKALKCAPEVVVGAIKSIQTFENVINVAEVKQQLWQFTKDGQDALQKGSPEVRLMSVIPAEGIAASDLEASPVYKGLGDAAKPSIGQAMKNKWIAIDKSSGAVAYVRKVTEVPDETQKVLAQLQKDPSGKSTDDKVLKDLKKRKLVEQKSVTTYNVTKGSAFTTTLRKGEADLTADMLADGSWKSKDFKPFNLAADGVPVSRGTLHPLLKVREEYRQIFLEMGFEEMPTSRFVESSFWNFDALFQPQQHPARDAHDTFFMTAPETSASFPADYEERVKNTHENGGGYESIGYQYNWERSEAEKNLLRTHTTAVSARMLYKLAQQKPFKPVKYFSIDRVFRNETLDATHLAEFHQIEGVIADYNLTLGDLMGTLHNFFTRLGIHDLRFKPAYNPYTEPSMEVFSYHAGLDKVVEIGNSGMFRPEMLRPMGLPEDVVVIAWGLSVERPTMIKYGYSNIRDLIGPKVDLTAAQSAPLVRL